MKPQAGVSRAELEVLRQKIVDKAKADPAKAAVILADWLKRPATGRSGCKKTG